MRSDRPLILAVIFLGVGLGVLIGYCNGASGFSASYPFTNSVLHVEMSTIGPGVVGGLAALVVGVVLLIWAFFAAIVSLFTGPVVPRTRVVERYSVVPHEETSEYDTETIPAPRRHFWSRSTPGTNL